MAKEDSLRVARILRVFNEFVRPARHGASAPLDVAAHHVHGEPVPYEEAVLADYVPFAIGDAWGTAWGTTWFRLQGEIPKEWSGNEVRLRFSVGNAGETGFGAESLLYRDGTPVQGLSPNHRDHRLADAVDGGELIELYVEAAANPRPPWGANVWPLLMPEPDGPSLFTLAEAGLLAVDGEFESFFQDFRIAAELLISLPEPEPRRARLLAGLEHASDLLDLPDVVASWTKAAPVVHELLDERASSSSHRVSVVGHAHLDTAWLWPLRETIRKCARTFSTALCLMERYPEYRFVISQAQHLAWMRDLYPAIWERLKARIAEGRIEPTGSMWIEADCNVPSGESLVRQIVFGKRFYLDELGIETEDVWLPDVFGYSAALPQIMRLGGAHRFLTQKLSWNQYDDMPHHTFYWEGIDGSRVFTHFPPADTYGGQMTAQELRHSVSNFRDHEHSRRSLYLYGHSDGGGGPTEIMLESARRLADSEGLPLLVHEGPKAFFEQAEAEIDRPAVWVGELYFEHHRGTYTTQGATKRGNRLGELALRDAELFSTLVGDPYPHERLRQAWQTLLVNQFHDIIPGSGIHWVYEDARVAYQEVEDCAGEIVEDALGSLTATIDTAGLAHPVVVWNSLSHARQGIVEVEGPEASTTARASDGSSVPLQHLDDGRAVFVADVPSCGYRAFELATGPAETVGGTAGTTVEVEDSADGRVLHVLDNGVLRVVVDHDGLVSSILDRRVDRHVLAEGARGNLLQLHPDYPNFFEAWDIDAWYRHRREDLIAVDAIDIMETGPVRASVRVVRSFSGSSITQTLSLASGSPLLRVDNEVEWHETNRLLKVAFPVAVRSPRATYEIQYGHVERPTHANTSWDAARFEVCGHKWADLSEPGYGVALLNDCKYGHDITDGVIRLSLLRSPNWPDPRADRGHHRFAYGLLPHPGDLRDAGVVDAGYDFNVPLRVVPTTPHDGERPPTGSFFDPDAGNVVLEVVKGADDGSGATVVRLYEAWGGRGPVRLSVPFRPSRAVRTDLLERELEPVAVVGRAIELDLGPFEIVTVRIDHDQGS